MGLEAGFCKPLILPSVVLGPKLAWCKDNADRSVSREVGSLFLIQPMQDLGVATRTN